MRDLDNNTNQLALTDVYSALRWTTAEYMFLSSVHRTLSRIDIS